MLAECPIVRTVPGGIRSIAPARTIAVRYDLLAPANLDQVIDDLRRLGYQPYFLLDDWEEPMFRDFVPAARPASW